MSRSAIPPDEFDENADPLPFTEGDVLSTLTEDREQYSLNKCFVVQVPEDELKPGEFEFQLRFLNENSNDDSDSDSFKQALLECFSPAGSYENICEPNNENSSLEKVRAHSPVIPDFSPTSCSPPKFKKRPYLDLYPSIQSQKVRPFISSPNSSEVSSPFANDQTVSNDNHRPLLSTPTFHQPIFNSPTMVSGNPDVFTQQNNDFKFNNSYEEHNFPQNHKPQWKEKILFPNRSHSDEDNMLGYVSENESSFRFNKKNRQNQMRNPRSSFNESFDDMSGYRSEGESLFRETGLNRRNRQNQIRNPRASFGESNDDLSGYRSEGESLIRETGFGRNAQNYTNNSQVSFNEFNSNKNPRKRFTKFRYRKQQSFNQNQRHWNYNDNSTPSHSFFRNNQGNNYSNRGGNSKSFRQRNFYNNSRNFY